MNQSEPSLLNPSPGLKGRHRISKFWRWWFFISTTIGIFALSILMINIIDQAFGYIIRVDKVDAATLSSKPLDELSKEELITILQENVSKNRLKVLDKENPIDKLSKNEILDLITIEIIKPTTQVTYHLFESLLHRDEILKFQQEEYPNGRMEFKAWFNWQFITRPLSTSPDMTGIRTALLGSLWIIFVTIIVAFPTGIGAAIYLEEFAHNNLFTKIVKTNIDNLAGIPSIVYGMLGLALFVRTLAPVTSGQIFTGIPSSGRTILSAGLTMALLILPLIIINGQEAIRAVPNSLREASLGLGATRLQTIWSHVLPAAMPGIMTGTILAISRAIGETAPLILVGASSFINKNPSSVFSNFTVLPIQIYNWTARPQAEFRNLAAAAIIVLLIALLSLNAAAILMRNKFGKNRVA